MSGAPALVIAIPKRRLADEGGRQDLADLGQPPVERQSPHAGRRVERLGDADEGDVVALEDFDQLGEIHQRAAEPVDLVDDDDVDQAGLDVGHQLLQPRPLQRAAGEAAVVVALTDRSPALGLLAGDIGPPSGRKRPMSTSRRSSRRSATSISSGPPCSRLSKRASSGFWSSASPSALRESRSTYAMTALEPSSAT